MNWKAFLIIGIVALVLLGGCLEQPPDKCTVDSDCDDLNAGTNDFCAGSPRECGHELADECSNDSDCHDGEISTADSCIGAPKTCSNEAITECIPGDNYCQDSCSYDPDADCPAPEFHWAQKIGEGNLAGLESCGKEKVLFSTFPVPIENFPVISPLGTIVATAHIIPTPHLFLRPRGIDPNDPESTAVESDVVAPAGIRVYYVTSVEDMSENKRYKTDYAVYFSPCTEVTAYFDHIVDLSEKIADAYEKAEPDFCREYTMIYGDGPVNWRYCRKRVKLDLEEGEYIGINGGPDVANVFDFALFDYRNQPHTFASPERWREYGNTLDEGFYVTCPLDYFPDAIKEGAYERLGSFDERRAIEPICGEVAQDIPGTAQGVWFREEYSGNGRHMSLVHDNTDPRAPVIAVDIGLESIDYGAYYYDVEDSGFVNRDFPSVVPGKIYCFDGFNDGLDEWSDPIPGRILIQMPKEKKLKLEKQEGECKNHPWEFTGIESFFER